MPTTRHASGDSNSTVTSMAAGNSHRKRSTAAAKSSAKKSKNVNGGSRGTTSEEHDGLEFFKSTSVASQLPEAEHNGFFDAMQEAEHVGRQRQNSVMSTAAAADGVAYSKKVREMDTTTAVGIPESVHEASIEPPLFDEACDPANPRSVKFQDVSAAAYKIRGGIVRTPCTYSSRLSKMMGMDLYFKKEFLQVTGSFKERGARFAMMKMEPAQREKGVIAASAGNHALALSYHGKQLDIPVTVVMPVIAPLMKITLCRSYGANVIIEGESLMESREYALKMAQKEGMKYDHIDILAGQGTIGLEILDDVKHIDAVLVPTGGGGLIAGMAVAIKYLQPAVKIIAVEAENCASFKFALENGRPMRCNGKSSLADGLSVATVGVNAFESCSTLIDETVTVSECDIALAILRLVENEKAVVEGAGAVGLAAVLAGKVPHLKGKRVVTVLCGGNIDSTVLGRCIERGLAVDGRLARFEVTVSDRPGGIAELATLLAHSGASIKDMFHERAWLRTDIYCVRVKVVVETRDAEHLLELQAKIRANYDECYFYNTASMEKSPTR